MVRSRIPARLRALFLRLGFVSAVLATAGCTDMAPDLVAQRLATLTPVNEQNVQLRLLPPPTKRIPVAVYDVPDLTGQYRERESIQSLSRAVSQGGGAMLIKALRDAGQGRWFTVLDRTNLDDLLRERQ